MFHRLTHGLRVAAYWLAEAAAEVYTDVATVCRRAADTVDPYTPDDYALAADIINRAVPVPDTVIYTADGIRVERDGEVIMRLGPA
jgi:hypothetical protein